MPFPELGGVGPPGIGGNYYLVEVWWHPNPSENMFMAPKRALGRTHAMRFSLWSPGWPGFEPEMDDFEPWKMFQDGK